MDAMKETSGLVPGLAVVLVGKCNRSLILVVFD